MDQRSGFPTGQPGSSDVAVEETARWPRVVGTIGVVVGVLMFLDKLDDLLLLPWLQSVDWWRGLVGDRLAADIVRWLPPAGWIVLASLVGMTLGTLLVVGGMRLRRRRRSGVALCRAWSWLAIAWLLVEVGWALYWFSTFADELPLPASGDWQGTAVFGTLAVIAVMAAFPVFLLSWFSRPTIKAQTAAWAS